MWRRIGVGIKALKRKTAQCSAEMEGFRGMPKWVVICPKCNHQLTYAEVAEEIRESMRRDPIRSMTRPAIERGGEIQKCSHCQREIKINACDLTYSYL